MKEESNSIFGTIKNNNLDKFKKLLILGEDLN
jgi:hypothetical protein